MSKQAIFGEKLVKKFDPIGSGLVEKTGITETGRAEKAAKAEAADKAAASAAGAPSVVGVQRAAAMQDRQSQIQAAAVAAGAVRGENAADTLGSPRGPKKRASKDLLGA